MNNMNNTCLCCSPASAVLLSVRFPPSAACLPWGCLASRGFHMGNPVLFVFCAWGGPNPVILVSLDTSCFGLVWFQVWLGSFGPAKVNFSFGLRPLYLIFNFRLDPRSFPRFFVPFLASLCLPQREMLCLLVFVPGLGPPLASTRGYFDGSAPWALIF